MVKGNGGMEEWRNGEWSNGKGRKGNGSHGKVRQEQGSRKQETSNQANNPPQRTPTPKLDWRNHNPPEREGGN